MILNEALMTSVQSMQFKMNCYVYSTFETQYIKLCLEIDVLYKLGNEMLDSIECIVIMIEGKKLILMSHTQMILSNSNFLFFSLKSRNCQFKKHFIFFSAQKQQKGREKKVCVCEEKTDCALKKIVAIQAFR